MVLSVSTRFYFSLVCEDKEKTIDAINSLLPPVIKVHSIKRVTKNFNCKSACDGRTYIYMLPTFAFAQFVSESVIAQNGEKVVPEVDEKENLENFRTTLAYRMSSEKRDEINKVLKQFIGSHFYHNYTSGK